MYHLVPMSISGIDYSSDGVAITEANLERAGIAAEIYQGDFFDDTRLHDLVETQDIVYSVGFIEHFDDPTEAIRRHFDLAKPGGLVVMTLPNLASWNRFFVSKEILALHNCSLMSLDVLRKLCEPYGEICELRYS